MSLIFLSHLISETSPGYGGKQGFKRTKTRSILAGDSANQEEWQLSGHFGTHIDTPYHFFENGKNLSEYSAQDLVFNKVEIVSHNAQPNEIIQPKCFESISSTCDLVLLKTGFESQRQNEIYWKQNPGLAPEVGVFLKSQKKSVKAIGFDFISLTSFENRELGRIAHKQFLNNDNSTQAKDSSILIIEDMALAGLTQSPVRVIIAPLRVDHADGAPVTVIAEMN